MTEKNISLWVLTRAKYLLDYTHMKNKVILDVNCLGTAIEILQDRGVKFDRVICPLVESKDWRGHTVKTRGVHSYFMQGEYDVAYYTEAMRTLFVHENPRPWDQAYLLADSYVTEFVNQYSPFDDSQELHESFA